MEMKSNNSASNPVNLGDTTTYQAGVAQSTAHRLLKKFTEDCIRPHGITMMQWFIIGTIHDAGEKGITVTELSRAVDTNVPYITNTLNLLGSKGIIFRDTNENDSRSKRVTINPAYEKTVLEIEADLRTKMREGIYAEITPQELAIYIGVLRKLTQLR